MCFSASIQKLRSSFGLSLGLQIACAVLATLASPAPAAAQFTVCNINAKAGIMVAISVVAGEPGSSMSHALTTTSGSTAVAAGECQALIPGSLFNIADIYIFAWEPSNPTHIWSGDPRDPYQRCVPTAGKDGKAPHFSYQDHQGDNPPCGPGQVKLNFMDLEIGFRQSYTKYFKDPEEGEAPQPPNPPPAAHAPGKAPPAAVPKSTPAPAAVPKPAPAVLSTPAAPTGNAVLGYQWIDRSAGRSKPALRTHRCPAQSEL